MFTVTKLKSAAKAVQYFRDLLDYYVGNAKDAVRRFGKGVLALNLQGPVERREFEYHLKGIAADGKRELVQNAGPHRHIGWDLHFAPPKDVSALWALLPDPWRKEIEAAHHASVDAALRHVENKLAFTRRGQGGKSQERAGILVTIFTHPTSRANEPQLHDHAFLHNLAFRQDGTIGALETREIYRAQRLLDAIYVTQFAAELRQRLGLEILPAKTGFHIQGVPKELCDAWSTRRKDILASMAEHGRQGAVAASIAAIETRPEKQEISREALFAQCQQVGRSFGFGQNEALKLINVGKKHEAQKDKFDRAFAENLDRVSQGKRSFSRVVAAARAAAIAHNVDGEGVSRAVEENVRNRSGFLRVEWERLFPHAPFWSPAKHVKAPVIKVGHKKPFRRWGKVVYRQDLILGELRIQYRHVFPNAPHFNPASKLKIPTIRVMQKSAALRPKWSEPIAAKQLGPLKLNVHSVKLFPTAKPHSLASKVNIRALSLSRPPKTKRPEHQENQQQSH